MIIQEQGDHLILIRQTDHAMLSGFFARALGNKIFSRPEPFESFCLAATEHDNGWNEWELLPQIDPRTFTPYNFMSIPTEEHVALYQSALDLMHCPRFTVACGEDAESHKMIGEVSAHRDTAFCSQQSKFQHRPPRHAVARAERLHPRGLSVRRASD